jgi:hypothetical protein
MRLSKRPRGAKGANGLNHHAATPATRSAGGVSSRGNTSSIMPARAKIRIIELARVRITEARRRMLEQGR